jgi:7-keto-8-aminopelargonate synthetase-like enzyme
MNQSATSSQTKTRHEQVLETIDEVTNISSSLGIAQLEIQDEEIHGASIQVKGRKVVNFGSCSYLGLEKHPKIIQGVVDAVSRYGSQFS